MDDNVFYKIKPVNDDTFYDHKTKAFHKGDEAHTISWRSMCFQGYQVPFNRPSTSTIVSLGTENEEELHETNTFVMLNWEGSQTQAFLVLTKGRTIKSLSISLVIGFSNGNQKLHGVEATKRRIIYVNKFLHIMKTMSVILFVLITVSVVLRLSPFYFSVAEWELKQKIGAVSA